MVLTCQSLQTFNWNRSQPTILLHDFHSYVGNYCRSVSTAKANNIETNADTDTHTGSASASVADQLTLRPHDATSSSVAATVARSSEATGDHDNVIASSESMRRSSSFKHTIDSFIKATKKRFSVKPRGRSSSSAAEENNNGESESRCDKRLSQSLSNRAC